MVSPTNPYIIEKPVTGAQFFGRESVVQAIEYILRPPSRTSVIIFGQRKIGKTSFLLHLTESLGPPFFPIYVDLAGRAGQPLAQILYQMATAAADKAHFEAPPLAAFLHNPDFFQEEFLPALYQNLDEQTQPTFLLDEFEPLDTPASQLPEKAAGRLLPDYVHKLLTTSNRLSFVFTAGRRMHELGGVGRTGSYARLNQYLSVLTPPQARRLILKPDAPAYESAALRRVIDLTRGHPYLLQILCHTIFEVTKERYPDKIAVNDVKAAAERLLDRHDTGLFLIWESIPAAEQLILAAAAERIITPNAAISETALEQALAQAGISATPAELKQAIQNLVAWQVLEKTAGGYSFFIDFFRRWISRSRPLEQVKISALPQLDPKLHDLYLAAHQAYTAGDIDSAFNKIIQILAIAPGFVQAHLLLGKIHSNFRRSAQAVKSYEAAYRYNPSAAAGPLVAALVSLGIQQEQRNDLDGARSSYRRVLEISPANNAARIRYNALTTDTAKTSSTAPRPSTQPATPPPVSPVPATESSPSPARETTRRSVSPASSRRLRKATPWWPVLVGVPLLLLILYGFYSLLPGQISLQDGAEQVAGPISTPTATTVAPTTAPELSTMPVATVATSAKISPTLAADLPAPAASTSITGGITDTSTAETNLAAGFVAPTATPTAPGNDTLSVATPPPPQPAATRASGVYVTGPTELLPLFTALAQAFSNQIPGLGVKFSTRTSPESIAAVQQRTADVALLSRSLSAYELTQMAEVAHILPLPQAEPIRVVVHPQLPFTDLAPRQLREIFSGSITNWRDVGGPDAAVKLVIPAESSDTGRVFQQHILGARPLMLGENTTITKNDADVYSLVASQPNAIGITAARPQAGAGQIAPEPSLTPARTLLIDNIAPTIENVTAGTYPVSRPIYVVMSNQLGPEARAWVEFIFGSEGERVIEETLRGDP